MGQPILLEGEPGVGKTEAAKALAAVLDTPLIRLQCYEGLTSAEALYEWNYPRQLLAIRLAEAQGRGAARGRPVQRRLPAGAAAAGRARPSRARGPAVLLIDEVDRGDDEFEAFLFELLAESAVTIPELGTRRAAYPPVVVLTSNRTRDLHDALKRRCLYHWIDYPDTGRVAAIIRRRVPGGRRAAGQSGGRRRCTGCAALDLAKPPGVAEAISWASALQVLGAAELDASQRAADHGRRAQVRRGHADACAPPTSPRSSGRCRRRRRRARCLSEPARPATVLATWPRWRPGSAPRCGGPGCRSGLAAASDSRPR